MAHQSAAGPASAASNPSEQGGGGAGGEAAAVVPILDLPERARKSILRSLPPKSLIHMASLSSEWRELMEADNLRLHLARKASPQALLDATLRRGLRRLHRFFITIENTSTTNSQFTSFLDYAGWCSAEDIHVVNSTSKNFIFRFQSTSQRLVHLSLTSVKVGSLLHYGQTTLPVLEVIEFDSVEVDDGNLPRVLNACPRLRVLHLRGCDTIGLIDVDRAGEHLVSLKVSECARLAELRASRVLGLRSFHYSGVFLQSIHLPAAASFAQLCICFGFSRVQPRPYSNNWFNALPNLSNLTVLTICSYALRVVFGMCNAGQKARLSNLRGLRELQLLMFEMKTDNLNDIYAFLKACHFTQLEKLFVQLPKPGSGSYVGPLNEVIEDLSGEGLERLTVVKITDFKWHMNEIELANSLFTKAKFLQKLLILVSPGFMRLECHLLGPAFANAQTVFSDDDPTVRPFHSDACVKKYV